MIGDEGVVGVVGDDGPEPEPAFGSGGGGIAGGGGARVSGVDSGSPQ